MSEQSGADRTGRVQLHLRVGRGLVELLDACRGAATRNAYAALILERALERDDGPSPASVERPVPQRAPGARPAVPEPPAGHGADVEQARRDACTHPGVGRKQRCPTCGRYNT